jgi:hypothetical protein
VTCWLPLSGDTDEEDAMTSPDDANPYPNDMPVWVKFPRSKSEEQGDRDLWP